MMQAGRSRSTTDTRAKQSVIQCYLTRSGSVILATILICCCTVTAQANTSQVVVFAGSANYPPYEWRDKSGQARGFDIALEDAIAQVGGRKAVHVLSDWPDAMAALESGKADVVAMFASQARAEQYAFTEPFYYASHAIFGPSDYPGVGGPTSLAGERVAVVQGGYAANMLRKYFPAVHRVPRPNIKAAVTAVADGSASFVVESRPVVARTIADLDLSLAQLSRPFWPKAYVFAVQRRRPELRAWLQRNLTQIESSGRYSQIYDQWEDQLEWHPFTWRDSLRYITWFVIPLLVLIMLALVWNRLLQRHVARKTQALKAELERRKTMEAALRHAATHTQLTNLPNRAEFSRRVDNLLAKSASHQGCVIALRFINLKEIASVFGHKAAEQAINQFAAHLAEANFPAVGDLRRGYFGIFTDNNGAALQAELTQPFKFEGSAIEPQIVAGSVCTDEAPIDAAELLRRAETALFFSTQSASQVTPYSSDQEPNAEDFILVRDFKQFGHSDIRPVFQPQYNIQTQQITGLEALVRWTHPTIGPVSPARFIPLLEQAGLACQVTTYMLDEAIRMTIECRRIGAPSRVSVNISAEDLIDDNLPSVVRARLQALGGEPESLILEVTETGLIDNPNHAARIFKELRNIGVGLSIDDFGTGYSSLTYLNRFPLTEMKIDRSFVSRMVDDTRHGAIVRWTINLAHELGLRVVAEGVEDERTLDALGAAGCDCAQGYVFSPPISTTEAIQLLQSQPL